MLSDGLIIGLLACGILTLMGSWKHSQPLIFISSVGLLISALQIFSQTSEPLPMALLLMISIAQFMLIKGD